ncbi:hypothetical protein COHA_001347 [Chlorella ohadii]|uniref:Protein kinase domain-containing protein n=1 Tax=Chlorella ohadii TaxID=2649997 RepID=A0AAD5DZ62_9CHLO|nr:hypothetical protein COHA_001347 [Chlorella ohadii]
MSGQASSNPINLRRTLPDTLPPEGLGGVQGTGASSRFSCGGYGGAGAMGACAYGSLPPAIRRTVSGRIFLEHQGGPLSMPTSQEALHARKDALLDPAEVAAGKPVSSPTGVTSLLTASVRSAASSASDLAAADQQAMPAGAAEPAHCASAAVQVSSLLLSPAARAARHRLRLQSAGPLASAAARGARRLGSVLQCYGEPAFVLLALAVLWARVHPSSQQIGECLAALIPVLAGYNQTARQCVRQGLSGDAAEELWRKQHKWAARRTAALLQDLPHSPPLAGAAAAWEALNIQIGAMVGSAHFGSLVALDSGGGVQLCASLGLRSRRSQQEQRAALSVAPGHVAATPAGPVEDEPEEAGGSSGGSQGSSAAGSICSKQRSEQLGGEWPHGSEQSSDGDQHAALQLPGLEQQSTAAECAGSSGAGASSDGKRGGTWDSPSERLKTAAWRLLLRACKRAGAATVKWAQWSSTREDVFPEEFCRVMSELHDRAPTHSMAETRRIVEAALGAPLESLFLSFEPRPLASGSIAQVHRATMLVEGQPQVVAVKVRHPSVSLRIWQDFQLLRPLAALTGRIRTLRSLNLSDSVAQFSHTMTAQADLRVEAAHLRRFYENFKAVGSSVRVPRPLPGLCTEAVLVETFEAGRSVSEFIRTPHPQNTQIVSLGLDTFLKMLLQDNFVHTDLHPGNILVRTAQHAGGSGTQQPTGGDNCGSQHGSQHSGGAGQEDTSRVELVLLDFGLAEELTPAVRHHFISFLHMISRGDGRRAAEHLLQWSVHQRCPDPEAFTAAIIEMFREKCDIHSEAGIDVDAVLKGVLHLARHHEVSIDSNYAALVVGVCVIVGFATSLDRRVNLMDAATPVFLYHALTGRVSGRLYM